MIKRTIEVSTEGTHLRLEQKQMVAERNGEKVGTVPFEDLGVLVIDSPRVSITAAAMTAAAENGAAVLMCGKNHHPVGMLLPMCGNNLLTQRIRHQLRASVPLRKQLWSRIVQAKVRNQAANIDPDDPLHLRLMNLSRGVRSGDPENAEGQAARLYWGALFADFQPDVVTQPFRRLREGPPPNNLFNYGYAILRAAVARAVCAAGLHPAIGLHHRRRDNPFILADDLMEPFRPFVDARVYGLVDAGVMDVNREAKRELLEVLTDRVRIGGETGPLLVNLQRTAYSLYRCFEVAALEDKAEGKRSATRIAEILELPEPPESPLTTWEEEVSFP